MAGPGGGPPRRSHTKSRKGCETCKRRHIHTFAATSPPHSLVFLGRPRWLLSFALQPTAFINSKPSEDLLYPISPSDRSIIPGSALIIPRLYGYLSLDSFLRSQLPSPGPLLQPHHTRYPDLKITYTRQPRSLLDFLFLNSVVISNPYNISSPHPA
jgi:hypothetical protein